uniref:F-box associated beta-propeller type 3 domain-containing protein n=1 Tax=Aegilops tauschii TaxID=37682 RepID=R7W9H2_AEGTA
MAEAATAAATPLIHGLPDEVVLWEILVRLDPKSLLRCRAHHDILAFDHRAAANAQLHRVARLDRHLYVDASCDGLLVLSTYYKGMHGSHISICNPTTRELASVVGPPWDFSTLGIYPHRPTSEYRLLLHQGSRKDLPKDQIGCFVLPLGPDQSPRYIGWPETKAELLDEPVHVHDGLHWYPDPGYHRSGSRKRESKPIIVFDTIAESFRQMHSPIVPTQAYIFEKDGMLGIYCHDDDKNTVGIWVLQNYESEVWDLKYQIRLPVEEIRGRVEDYVDYDFRDINLWDVNDVSGDGGMLLLVNFGWSVFHIDTDGKLIDSFNFDLQRLCVYQCQLKQSLVQHTFFPALKGYVVNASLFI